MGLGTTLSILLCLLCGRGMEEGERKRCGCLVTSVREDNSRKGKKALCGEIKCMQAIHKQTTKKQILSLLHLMSLTLIF